MTIGIYKITNKKTGQIYIGQSVNIERRFKEHISGYNCPKSYIDNTIQKYGKANFNFEIIEKFNKNTPFLNDVLNDNERYYIALYNTFKNDFHYNLTPGGDFNPMKVPEIAKKSGKTQSGENNPMYGKKHSEKTKKKISERMSGKNNPNYGNPNNYHHSDETKRKMSENSPVWKNYARIVKAGKNKKNKQRYVIKYQGKTIKTSISIDTLKKWFSKNYPNQELIIEVGY